MQDVIDISVEQVMTEIKENLLEFDTGWSTFENRYVVELMGI